MKIESFFTRHDDDTVVNIAGTYVPEQEEIRYPNDRAQEGIPAHFADIEGFLDDGTEVELMPSEMERVEYRLFEALAES